MRSEDSDGAHLICGVQLELLLRHEHLGAFSKIPSLDDATWRKCSASFALEASSIAIKLDTSTYVPFRCRVCPYATPILVRPSHCEIPTPCAPVVSYVVGAPECVNHHVSPFLKVWCWLPA